MDSKADLPEVTPDQEAEIAVEVQKETPEETTGSTPKASVRRIMIPKSMPVAMTPTTPNLRNCAASFLMPPMRGP